ncbi:MAG: radical SAM protein [Clostridia bacterium]|nr:radical SAM protein [Clostridia bacterium]
MITNPVSPPITEYLYSRASNAGVPISGTFELTPLCNMDCKMCYVRLSWKEQEAICRIYDAEKWLELAREARDAGMLYLLLTGGEPFLYHGFRQVMEGLNKLGLIVSINSNGTLIDETVISWLKNCPPMRINISIYGASDDTYAKLCNNPRGFTQVTNAIRLLKEAGISVKLNCSLTPDNADELPLIVEYAKENDLVLQVATYMFPPLRKAEDNIGQNSRFTPEQAAYYTVYSDYLLLGTERFLARENRVIGDIEDDCAGIGDGIRCRAGKCSFWITWKGTMTPCGMFPEQDLPNVFEMSFCDAWEKVKEYASGIVLPSKCAGCSAKDDCRACAAMVITESGSFDKVPQYRCDMTHSFRTQWERVKEKIQ